MDGKGRCIDDGFVERQLLILAGEAMVTSAAVQRRQAVERTQPTARQICFQR